MRIIALLFFCAAAALAQAAPAEFPPPVPAKIEFVRAIAAKGMRKLLGHDGDRFYVAYPDGSIRIITGGKEESATLLLPAQGHNGGTILKRPEAAVAAGGAIYAVDAELSQVAMFSADGKYKGSFGHKGSNAGELRAPQGIAFRDGILYVADSGNGRIQLYGDNGVFLDTLEIDRAPVNQAARESKMPYRLNRPAAVALDPSGRTIYVLDGDDSLFGGSTSIKTYGLDGTFLGQLPKNGNPFAISAVPDGLYAAERDSFAIQKYGLDGALVSAFGSRGDGPAQFRSMDGLAADSGQVYLGDRARGVIYDFRTNAFPPPSALGSQQTARASVRWTGSIPASAAKMAWDGKDTLYGINRKDGAIVRFRDSIAQGELKLKDKGVFPVAAAVDPDGALWVLDRNKAHAVKVDAAGNTLAFFGMMGSENGQFDHPADIAVSRSGVIFIADAGNHRVQAFSADGVFLSAIGGGAAGKLKRPEALALDAQDNLYVLDTGRATVSSYTPKGEALAEFGQDKADAYGNLVEPRGLMVTRDEVLVVEPGRVKVYSREGKYLRAFGAPGHGNGEFTEAAAIAAKNAVEFFVADEGNRRIQTFATLYKPAPPAQVTAQGQAHAVQLRWTASPLPYVAQYRIYRSKDEGSGFVRIGASTTNSFADGGLPPDEKYFYRVAAETDAGQEGLASPPVTATPQKYSPPRPENIQATATATQVNLSWNPPDLRYISAYLIYLKAGDNYARVGETVVPEFTVDGLTPGAEYTFYVTARSVDGIESEKTVVHATTAPHKPPQ